MERLKELRGEFGRVYKEGLKKQDFDECRPLFREIRGLLDGPGTEIGRFRAVNVAPELNHLKLHEQYESQVDVAWKSGLFGAHESVRRRRGGVSDVHKLPVIERGGKKYPMPSWKEVQHTLRKPENLEIIKEKSAQGFTKMLIVPFGYDLMTMADSLGQNIMELALDSELGDNKGIFCPDGSLAQFDRFSEEFPLFHNDAWIEEAMRYYPDSYSPDPFPGMSKQEAINMFGAWQICFVEDNAVIPNVGEVVGGRQQIDQHGSCYKHDMDMDKPVSFKEVFRRKSRFFNNPEKYEHEICFTAEQDLWMRLDYLLGGKEPVLLDYASPFSRYSVFFPESFNYLTNTVPGIGFSTENGEEISSILLNMLDPYEGEENATARTLVMLK